MWTIFRQSFRNSRGQILGWGLSLAALGAFLIPFYDTLADQQEQLSMLFNQYPPEMMAFFGGLEEMFTPHGYLHTEFFSYMPLILGIYVVLVGSGLIASDEENGTLDLVLAHPISRAALFGGRLLAFVLTTLAILVVAYLGFIALLPTTKMELTSGEMALPFLSLFAILVFFGLLAVLLSMLLPSRRAAAMTAGLVLVAGYFITSLRSLDDSLNSLAGFSPLSYYQGGRALQGVEWGWLAGLLVFSLAFGLLAWFLFERRDIRVGGEGGWRLDELGWRKKSQGPQVLR